MGDGGMRGLARVTSFAIDGIDARRVTVEVDIRQGLPAFTVIGLGDKAVREARERVRAAIQNSGFKFPGERITVNLAPAYLRKAGPGFDLAVAVGVLAASRQLPAEALDEWAVFGELSLGGELRPCGGTLSVAEGAARDGAGCGKQRTGDGEVEARTDLAQVRRCEVDGGAALREVEARVEDRRADALARLAHGTVGEADDREVRQPLPEVHLDGDAPRLEPVDREGGDRGEHGSERPFEVVEPHHPATRVEDDADRVEPQVEPVRALRHLAEVGGGHPAHLLLLVLVEPVPRRGHAPGTPRLDLHEDERAVVGHDEVQLAEAGAVVAGDDLEAEPFQMLGRELLSPGSERRSDVHATDAKRRA